MTSKLAIKILTGDVLGTSEQTHEAVVMAVKALSLPSAQQWIPCKERLPEENKAILLGVKYKDDFKMFVTARMDITYWQGLGRDIKCQEMRWMPLPEPWKGEDDE